MVTFFHFEHHLTAGTAGYDRAGCEMSVDIPCCDAEGYGDNVGMSGTSGKEGAAFGAESVGVGAVLLVAAGDDGAVLEEQGGTDGEVGVGGVAVEGGRLGLFYEKTFLGGEFGESLLL